MAFAANLSDACASGNLSGLECPVCHATGAVRLSDREPDYDFGDGDRLVVTDRLTCDACNVEIVAKTVYALKDFAISVN